MKYHDAGYLSNTRSNLHATAPLTLTSTYSPTHRKSLIVLSGTIPPYESIVLRIILLDKHTGPSGWIGLLSRALVGSIRGIIVGGLRAVKLRAPGRGYSTRYGVEHYIAWCGGTRMTSVFGQGRSHEQTPLAPSGGGAAILCYSVPRHP